MRSETLLAFNLSLVAFLGLLLAVACGTSGPTHLEVPVKLEEGGLTPHVIQVKQGDMVMLKIQAHEAGQLHLHGYDIEQELASGGVTEMQFTADATGRFKLTFHQKEGDDHATPPASTPAPEDEEKEVGFLEVLPR
jgi:hypothetical protein